jgi:hypothetical protein
MRLLRTPPTTPPCWRRLGVVEPCDGPNGVLPLIAERVCGRSYHDLVRELVCSPAA